MAIPMPPFPEPPDTTIERMKALATSSADAALNGAAYRVVRNIVLEMAEPYRLLLPAWALEERTVAAAIWVVAALPIVAVPGELPPSLAPFAVLIQTCVGLAQRAAAGAAVTFGAEGADVAYALAKRGLGALNTRLRDAGVTLGENGELRLLDANGLRPDDAMRARMDRIEAEFARRGGAS